MDVSYKQCPKCPEGQQWHPATPMHFHRDKNRKDGLFIYCKVCKNKREGEYNSRPEVKKRVSDYDKLYQKQDEVKKRRNIANRQYTYGLPSEAYLMMVEEHKGLCAMCDMPEPHVGKSLAVDHNHDTGQVRGLLCSICNTRLSVLEDSEFVASARAYLAKHET